ncbi:MAG: D-aminoacyl-tRNA deacylase [Candidatus Thorarchaeota archaeon]
MLVCSEKDLASQTIHQALIEEHGFRDTGDLFEGNPVYRRGDMLLITTNRDLIYCEHLDEHFEAEAFVFCSRHRSESGRPALLVHSTGNFATDVSLGGLPETLSFSAPSLVSVALRTLYEQQQMRGLDEFDVTLEVTHHGPTGLKTPLVFVELGSTETHWADREGASAVAEAIVACGSSPMGTSSAVGFGGPHYASKFTKLVLGGSYNIGHIASKHVLDAISPDVVKQMVRKSADATRVALIDWKGTSAVQRERFLPVLDEIGLEVVRAHH